ncbi:MAG TPA: hypothetical protein VGN57_19660 [Pirellulaceae bacterium]|jgi:hypothetical protein|nr:hypothetical protein [Pirellulaceae bacterium]
MNFLRLVALALLAASSLPALVSAEDLFVAAGYGGRRMISTDGVTWEITEEWAQPGGDDGNNLMSAVWAEGKFVAVGGGGGGRSGDGHVLVSTDGREWKRTHHTFNRINPIVYGDGRFVAGGPDRSLIVSDDAETWTEGAQIEEKACTHFRGGAYGNGRFVFVGNHGGGGGPHWSVATKDGTSIDGVRTDLPGHGRIVFQGSRFLMLTSHTKAGLIASADGLDWKPVAIEGAESFEWLVDAGDTAIVGNHEGMWSTSDGEAWTKREGASRSDVVWSDGKRFIATGWPGKMFFSPDGVEWKASPKLTDNGINVVVRQGERTP